MLSVLMISLRLLMGCILVRVANVLENSALGVIVFLIVDQVLCGAISSLILRVPGVDLIVCWLEFITLLFWVSLYSSGVAYSPIFGFSESLCSVSILEHMIYLAAFFIEDDCRCDPCSDSKKLAFY